MDFFSERAHRIIINFLSIFITRSIQTRKNWPIFFSFNPFPSMSSVATGDRKKFQYLQVVLNNKTRSLVLEFTGCEDTFKLFIKLPIAPLSLLPNNRTQYPRPGLKPSWKKKIEPLVDRFSSFFAIRRKSVEKIIH